MVATLALLAAACGTGSEDDTPVPAEPTATALVIGGSSPEAMPTETMGNEPMEMERSVSGVPLDSDARFGGTLRTSYTTNSPFIPWEEAAGSAFPVAHLLNNMLIKPRTWGTEADYNNFAYFELHPDLAESWEQSAAGLDITFTLRDGIEWSDGTALTCNDVKWSFDAIRLVEEKGLLRSPRKTHYLSVNDITCPDDLTVNFNLIYPKPAILEVIGQPYNVIFPAHIYETEFEETGRLDSLREEPATVTTGAFRLATYLPGEVYVFERNDDYWDQPYPYLDSVEMQFLARPNVPLGLRAGRLHIGNAAGYTGSQADTLIQECGADVCQFWNRVIASSFSPALFLNKNRDPWNNPKLNEAFALAIDNQKYITTVRDDWYELPTGCGFYPTSKWAMPAERCAQLPGFGDVIGTSTPEEDKERAREIMREAGFVDDEGNPSIDLKLTVWQPIEGDGPQFAQDLEQIGVNVTLDVSPSAEAYTRWSNADFDVGVHSFWIAGLDPDVTLYEHFYTDSDRNYNEYSNLEFDNLVNQMSRTLDEEERKRLAWDAMEVALGDVAKIVVSHSSYVPAASVHLRGFMPALNYLAAYGPQYRYDHVWLDR
jgi:peptide/nickel transport system substrate-binding protein